jgi:SAM-dependent methyltransferase
MGLFPPLPRAEHAVEMLDRPAPFADLAQSLADIARLNALFGGRFITLAHVRRLLAGMPRDRTITVLDVGSGGADVPRALARWARRVGRRLRILALDRDRATLGFARHATASYPEIVLLQGDALALPVRPGSIDIVISALTLHHLEPAAAVRYLAQMDASARVGLVVNDLVRSRAAYAIVWLATRALTRNRMSRHDGPLSVLRSYTPQEVWSLCQEAGLLGARVLRYPPMARQCAVRSDRSPIELTRPAGHPPGVRGRLARWFPYPFVERGPRCFLAGGAAGRGLAPSAGNSDCRSGMLASESGRPMWSRIHRPSHHSTGVTGIPPISTS